jgi:hypothetical protein
MQRLELRRGDDPLHDLQRRPLRQAVTALEALDTALQTLPPGSRESHVLRARAGVAELIDALRLHSAYFDANPAA